MPGFALVAMTVLVLSGTPARASSRSHALAQYASDRLGRAGLPVRAFGLHDVPAEDLIAARIASVAARSFQASVAASRALVIATPIYNASFPGGLKALLDLLPPRALAGKAILPLATCGSTGHRLAIEYSLQPVLSALGASHVLAAVYASDADVALDAARPVVGGVLRRRLDQSIDALVAHLAPAPVAANAATEPFDERCPA